MGELASGPSSGCLSTLELSHRVYIWPKSCLLVSFNSSCHFITKLLLLHAFMPRAVNMKLASKPLIAYCWLTQSPGFSKPFSFFLIIMMEAWIRSLQLTIVYDFLQLKMTVCIFVPAWVCVCALDVGLAEVRGVLGPLELHVQELEPPHLSYLFVSY